MKYIPYFLIALCFLLLLGYCDLGKEISELKARDRLRKEQIGALQGQIDLCDEKSRGVVAEVREIMEGKQFIPVWDYRTFLVYDEEEENNANKD